MNILLIAFACEPNKGSEEGVGWNWAINLAKKHKVYVITRGQEQEFIEKNSTKEERENIEFFYFEDKAFMHIIDKKIPYGFRIYYKWWQKKIVPIAERIISEYNIDIIHQLTYNEYRTPGKLYEMGIPFVWGPIGGGHEYNPKLKEAYFSVFDVLKEIIRKKMNHWYLREKDVVGALKKASSVIVADPATLSILPKNRVYERLLETAYYSERNEIKNYSELSSSKKIHLLYAGVMQPRKGLKIIFDALGECDFRDFELVMIGEGSERKKLEKLAHKYGMDANVRFTGKLAYDEVNNYYDWADLFLFPSLRDTSGNVILEAMSHGTPVIALNHNGASEMITLDCGELIDIKSYKQVKQEFVSLIIKYYKNRELEEQKGLLARKRVEEVYSWERTMCFIDSIYRKAIEEEI